MYWPELKSLRMGDNIPPTILKFSVCGLVKLQTKELYYLRSYISI
jgi:hypothetical protein